MHKTGFIRIKKRSELTAPPRSVAGAAAMGGSAPPKHTEPQVQFIERSPGVYDILFTCRCGEQSVIRVESLEPAPAS